MSYDIELRIPEGGEATLDAARVRNARAISALQHLNPRFELFESDDVAELTDISNGIQVSLFRESGALSVPYWHESNAAQVLDQIGRCIQVLVEEAGYFAFDPQTDRKITAESEYRPEAPAYAFGVNALKSITKRPWWRFWQSAP